jgi:hypothetical protein
MTVDEIIITMPLKMKTNTKKQHIYWLYEPIAEITRI